MIKAYCYSGDNGHDKCQIKPEDISEYTPKEGNFLWVDIEEATRKDLETITEEFNIHDLSVEDVLKSLQRPKIEQYENYLFIVIYGINYLKDKKSLEVQELGIFLGTNFTVTIRNTTPQFHNNLDAPPFPLETLTSAWENQRKELKKKGSPMLLYTIIDVLVDRYFSVNDFLEDKLDKIEDNIFEIYQDKDVMEEIYQFKKELLSYRRVVAPLKDVVHTLTSREITLSGAKPLFDLQSILYFQDVYDHVIRVHEAIDMYRDLLTSALEVQLAVVSNRLNEVMKKMTSIAAIIAVPTLIASIYGMNFKFMPELNYIYAYFIVLILMLFSSGIIAYFFKKYKWF